MMFRSSKSLADFLEGLLESGKISKTELHKRTGIGRPNIDAYISLKSSPTLDSLDRISEAIAIPPWDLIKDHDEEKSSVQREIISLVSRMNDAELDPFLKMLRAWPGNASFKAREQKKQA